MSIEQVAATDAESTRATSLDADNDRPPRAVTALLVIDVQESFRQSSTSSAISPPDIAERVHRLVEHVRSEGEHVIWILHAEPGSKTAFDPDLGHVRFIPPLEPRSDERVVVKSSHNAFTTTSLARDLTSLGVTDLIIVGIRTEQCCETTARLASDLGYRVRFVLDATATEPLPVWHGTGTIDVGEIQQRTASALDGRFCEVVTMSDILGR
jgi:nicotinamidase-related amidase